MTPGASKAHVGTAAPGPPAAQPRRVAAVSTIRDTAAGDPERSENPGKNEPYCHPERSEGSLHFLWGSKASPHKRGLITRNLL